MFHLLDLRLLFALSRNSAPHFRDSDCSYPEGEQTDWTWSGGGQSLRSWWFTVFYLILLFPRANLLFILHLSSLQLTASAKKQQFILTDCPSFNRERDLLHGGVQSCVIVGRETKLNYFFLLNTSRATLSPTTPKINNSVQYFVTTHSMQTGVADDDNTHSHKCNLIQVIPNRTHRLECHCSRTFNNILIGRESNYIPIGEGECEFTAQDLIEVEWNEGHLFIN